MSDVSQKKVNIHAGHRQRMREKLEKGGMDALADHEVIEMLLYYVHSQKNTNTQAHNLLDAFGSLSNVIDAAPEDIKNVDGVGEASARLINFVHDLFGRYYTEKSSDNMILNTPDKIGKYVSAHYLSVTYEEFAILTFDSKLGLINFHSIEKGSPDKVSVNVRRLVEFAIRDKAAQVVLCHNHPNGIAVPSQKDQFTTIDIVGALKAIGITVIDHIIVAGNDYISMASSRQFKYIFK